VKTIMFLVSSNIDCWVLIVCTYICSKAVVLLVAVCIFPFHMPQFGRNYKMQCVIHDSPSLVSEACELLGWDCEFYAMPQLDFADLFL
jgi:hypothetical protein